MFAIQLDPSGPYRVSWPKKADSILILATHYLEHEASKSESERVPCPSYDTVRALYDKASSSDYAAVTGETQRATSAEALRQSFDDAINHLKKAILALKVKYSSNLAQLEAWGLKTKVVKEQVKILMPGRPTEWLDLLAAYVARESSLEGAEQISDPPIERMQSLNQSCQDSRSSRNSGKTQRQQGIATRAETLEKLREYLQVAAGVLLCRQDCEVTRDLESWGFTVIASESGSSTKANGTVSAAKTSPATASGDRLSP